MQHRSPIELISAQYRDVFGARQPQTFDRFMACNSEHGSTAALGYRRADQGNLYLEIYLDEAIEDAVSRAFGKTILRADIVELGNLAAVSGIAMIQLWGRAANDLGSTSQVAVATLTLQMRAMFARIGLPLTELAPARPDAVAGSGQNWGKYYDADPVVCAGLIAEGQHALARHFARREIGKAA
jgi:hypothetical protein